MKILRLTALAVVFAAPFMPGIVFSQTVTQNQGVNPVGVGQTPSSSTNNSTQFGNAQPVGVNQSFSNGTPGTNLQTPGTNLQTPGVGLPTPGTTSTSTNGQTVQGFPSTTTGTTGIGQTGVPNTTNGSAIGPSLPNSTKVPGAEQTFVNGQSVGTTQVAPPLTGGTTQILNNGQLNNGQAIGNQAAPSGVNGIQTGSNAVLYPPQLLQGGGSGIQGNGIQGNGVQGNGVQGNGVQGNGIQGNGIAPQAGSSFAPARSPTGLSTNAQPQLSQPQARGTAATGTTAAPNTTNQAPPSVLQGQGTLDAALQQATCAQDWQRAIRVVNTAIAAAPANQSAYRAQLTSYRSRLQNLQAKGVRAPNWAQQCRGGNLATNER